MSPIPHVKRFDFTFKKKLTKHQKDVLGTSMTETAEQQRKRRKKEPPKVTIDTFFKRKSSSIDEQQEQPEKSLETHSHLTRKDVDSEKKLKGKTPSKLVTKQPNGLKKETKETKSVIPVFHPKSSGNVDFELEPSEFENSMKHLHMNSSSKPKMRMNVLK